MNKKIIAELLYSIWSTNKKIKRLKKNQTANKKKDHNKIYLIKRKNKKDKKIA